MTIEAVAKYLESIAPLSLQEDYDNAGLLTGDLSWECTGVLCTLDVTEEVIAEAVNKSCNCIVAHHPVIFRGLKQLSFSDHVSRTIMAAVKNGIAIYACHTNLDNIPAGVNGKIADRLGLENRSVLSVHPIHPGAGAGLTGHIKEMTETEFLNHLKQQFNLEIIRHTSFTGKRVKKVAVCGGAGSFLISRALAVKADVYVTSDIKYHEFFEADGRMLICDIGHYESEQFTTDLFVELLLQKFPTFAVLKSEVKTNPVSYFAGK